MTWFVLALCLGVLGVMSMVWSGVRHRQVTAWDRELDAAFGTAERPEVPRHRSL